MLISPDILEFVARRLLAGVLWIPAGAGMTVFGLVVNS
jgi:hypothetical protein